MFKFIKKNPLVYTVIIINKKNDIIGEIFVIIANVIQESYIFIHSS